MGKYIFVLGAYNHKECFVKQTKLTLLDVIYHAVIKCFGLYICFRILCQFEN